MFLVSSPGSTASRLLGFIRSMAACSTGGLTWRPNSGAVSSWRGGIGHPRRARLGFDGSDCDSHSRQRRASGLAVVAEVLVKHGANVRAASLELGVPTHDLRRLTLVNQALIDAAYEAEELRLDRAEAVVDEALQSDDSRRRDAAAYFVLRNSAKSKKRGWIPSSSASVDVSVNAAPPVFTWRPMPSELRTEEARAKRRIVWLRLQRAQAEGHEVVQFSWRNSAGGDDADGGGEADGETIERDGRRIRMPRYGDGRRDESDCLEGELTPPAAMIEHAAAAASLPLSSPSLTRARACRACCGRVGRRPLRARADRRLDQESPHRLPARLLSALSHADRRGAGLGGSVERRGESALSSDLSRRMAY